MRRIRRCLCVIIACAACAAFAEPVPVSTADPTPEVTPGPTADTTPEVTEEPTAEPTAEPTPEPTAEPTPELTEEPTAEPTAEPTPEPTPLPAMEITVEGDFRLEDGTYVITFTSPEDPVAFAWQAIEGADAYSAEITDGSGGIVYSAILDEPLGARRLSLPASAFEADGGYTLKLQALAVDGTLAEGRLSFRLVHKEGGMPPGGNPGRAPGGGNGGGNPGGGSPVEDPGFKVTPGVALTASHSSGSKDMLIYGAVALETEDGAQTELVLGGTKLEITLDDGAGFTAVLDGAELTLTPAEGSAVWHLSGLALKTLSLSGVESLRLVTDGLAVEVPTAPELTGAEYARLRARGYVSKDYAFSVTAEGITAAVADAVYDITENYELIRK